MNVKGSNEGHCSSEHGGEIVITPFDSCPNDRNQRVIRLCINLETPEECHFIVMGVRRECFDALDLDKNGAKGAAIDIFSLRGVPADFSGNARVVFYNQDCPMYKGADRRVPVKLTEFEVPGGDPNDLKPLLRAIVEKARNVFAASPEVSDIVVDAVFPRVSTKASSHPSAMAARGITRGQVLGRYGHRKYQSVGEDILAVFRKRDGVSGFRPEEIADILMKGRGGFSVDYSTYDRGALAQRVRRGLEWILQCQKSSHCKDSFSHLGFRIEKKKIPKKGDRAFYYVISFSK